MASALNRAFIGWSVALTLTACASSVPSNFQYETSLRGEQGFMGRSDKISAAESVLEAGVVTDPALSLRAAFPDADIRVRKWGLRYFRANWARYQVVLDVDIKHGDDTKKCREVSTETPVGAPTLNELTANNGAEIQQRLMELVKACAGKQP